MMYTQVDMCKHTYTHTYRKFSEEEHGIFFKGIVTKAEKTSFFSTVTILYLR